MYFEVVSDISEIQVAGYGELNYTEAHGIGKRKMKIKRYLDRPR
jgi:hypothetical protein